jgi:heme-degrading monooxygenase HmoA
MGEGTWASGRWQVKDGMVDEFVQRWTEWLQWTSETVPGFRWARLLRSQDDPLRFTSFSEWDGDASRKAWGTTEGFEEKFSAARSLCDEFVGGDFNEVSSVMPAGG